MDQLLIQKLNELWQTHFPFVCFRLPNENQAVLYFQKDDQLHLTQNLDCNGFLMAPFELENKIPFIPDRYSEVHDLQNFDAKKVSDSAISMPIKEKKNFIDLVTKAKALIAKGQFKKVVLSQKHELTSKKNTVKIVMDLIYHYPSAMVYLWHHPSVGTWFGASPEKFINSKGAFTQTMALAGTQVFQENKTPKWTKKEREEQELVSIQVEKDLIKLFPSSQIRKSPTTNYRAGNLIHLCTDFQFPSLSGNLFEVAKVLHPTPAVGGVPKKGALEFIQNNERYKRSFYTGFFGPTNSSETQFFVNLRCAQWTPNKIFLFVGAGITQDSDPEMEWIELQRKAKTLSSVL